MCHAAVHDGDDHDQLITICKDITMAVLCPAKKHFIYFLCLVVVLMVEIRYTNQY